jgi:hypothetical protein
MLLFQLMPQEIPTYLLQLILQQLLLRSNTTTAKEPFLDAGLLESLPAERLTADMLKGNIFSAYKEIFQIMKPFAFECKSLPETTEDCLQTLQHLFN